MSYSTTNPASVAATPQEFASELQGVEIPVAEGLPVGTLPASLTPRTGRCRSS